MSQQEAEVWRAGCLLMSLVCGALIIWSVSRSRALNRERQKVRRYETTPGVKELLALRDIGAHRTNGKH